jgi:uncharacterized spore protein YtfJ
MKTQKEILKEDKTTLVERIAEKLGGSANAKYIYAEPVERDGVTVIPVARAAYGFGGGGGETDGEKGSGGGGGVLVKPVGYIEMKNGETRFRPTRDWLTVVPMIAAAAPTILFSVWGMQRLLRKNR